MQKEGCVPIATERENEEKSNTKLIIDKTNYKISQNKQNDDIKNDPAYLNPDILNDKLLEMRMKGAQKLTRERALYEAGRVDKIALKNNVVFVHGIDFPHTRLVTSRTVVHETDFLTCAKIAYTLSPHLAASAVRENYGTVFADVGFIIKNGNITNAKTMDGGSIAKKLKQERVMTSNNYSVTTQKETLIENVIKNTDPKKYNEFNIQNPEFLGIYINIDNEGKLKNKQIHFGGKPSIDINISMIFDEIKELEMPVYAMYNGVIYEAEYNKSQDIFQKTKKISPQDIINTTFKPSTKKKNEFLKEILDNTPFKRKSTAEMMIDSYTTGKNIFLGIDSKFLPETYYKPYKAFSKRKTPSGVKPMEIDRKRDILNVPGVSNIDSVMIKGKTVWTAFVGEEGSLKDPTITEYVHRIIKVLKKKNMSFCKKKPQK